MRVRIAVFDDDVSIRNHIASILKSEVHFDVVGLFKSGKKMMEDLISVRPNIVIMDIETPGFDSIEAISSIKTAHPDIQILIQAAFPDEVNIYQSIVAGASGYILKSQLQLSLVMSLNELCTGGAPLSPAVARQVVGILQNDDRPQNKPIKDYGLTPREKDVLLYLVEGLSYKMIGAELKISYETVRSHMKNIYTKLEVESLTAVVAKAINQNLLSS
jgi:DNA-binding NarL/FixJ family response regulator